jgi:large subunit ribosomal protein L15
VKGIEMKKRIKRIRGTRTCGGGSHKKRRGSGSKGGVGNAGAYDVHIVRSLKQGLRKGHNASPSFVYGRPEEASLNVGELDELLDDLVRDGKAEEREGGIYLNAEELGIQKVLGKGLITKKLLLKVTKISKTAQEKIEQVGGRVELELESEVV